MKTSLISLALALILQIGYAQTTIPVLSTDDFKPHTAYFTIKNNRLQGEGVSMVQELISKSQFIVYGETHGSHGISKLHTALMPLLADADFNYFAVEVGPHSADKLMELSTPATETIERLKNFNSAYTVSQGDDAAIPIPFFDNISDAEFLKAARTEGMRLWGIDQEYYFSTFFLMDELTKTVKNKKEQNQIKQLEQQAKAIMYQHFLNEFQDKNDGAYELISKEPVVASYFEAFDKNNSKAQSMIEDMKFSWDVYINWRRGSHADRISYMRNNFMKNYLEASKSEKHPKVYTKIGSLHAKKILTNGAYDIGDLVENLAKTNGTIASSINTWIPFKRNPDGTITNNIEERPRAYRNYATILPLANKEAFTIIALEPIRKAIDMGKIALPTDGSYHQLRQLIYGYDYHIILPIDEPTSPNRITK